MTTATCQTAQNAILLADTAAGVPAAARDHAAGCDRCSAFVARLALLDSELADLPAPPSGTAKYAFLDTLTAAGPVIKAVPAASPRGGTNVFALARRLPWRPAAAVAAAVLVVVGVVSTRGGKKPPATEPDSPRHELLAKVVKIDAELARLTDPQDRIPKLGEMADAIQTEATAVHKAARTKDEMRSLAGMFEKVVADGIVAQAGQFRPFTPQAEKNAILTAAADRLAAAETAANDLAASAPPGAKEPLQDIAKAAQAGRAKLLLARG